MSANKTGIPLLPLRDIVVFPFMVIPLFVGREKSVHALEKAMAEQKHIFLSAQKNPADNDPGPDAIYATGTLANILQILKLTDGTMKVLVEGLQRGHIRAFNETEDYYEVEIETINEDIKNTQDITALMRGVSKTFEQYVKLNPKIPLEAVATTGAILEPHRYADTIAGYLVSQTAEKQELLETYSPEDRLQKLLGILKSEMEILKIEKRVHGRVRKQMERSQKEFYLNEQIKAIQKELGKRDEFKSDIDDLADQIKKAKMPKAANERAMKELKRLELMQPMSAEATVSRTYIECLVELPWKKGTGTDKIKLETAQKVLDEDHFGLEKIKERIIEHLAVLKRVKKLKGPILCLVGPPGVGKTSLGKSIARATGKKFVRVSLGGVRDEAEIRGHRRTYIGALPGKIIQGMQKAGSMDPVFMLDEIDKMGSDFRGDPASALLEVLDPEQNSNFNDHYLEIDYDLSQALFICTANVLHTIPSPLLDRMEVIRLAGYTDEEKVKIAENFLIPKKLKDHGIEDKNLSLNASGIKKIIREYTREAGVRNLERELSNLCRKAVKKVVEEGEAACLSSTPANIEKNLGIPKFPLTVVDKTPSPGIVTGLAWTEVGGEILTIEALVVPGKGRLSPTGKLGEVMKESAEAAMSYVRSRASDLGLAKDFYHKNDFHIHIPEGAVPKDGPSAGITMATAMVSALTGHPARRDIAMTGELTLSGKVLGIGGLKEKSLAAHREGILEILIPASNEKDIQEIPPAIRKTITFHTVSTMDDVIALAFDKKYKMLRKKNSKKKSLASKKTSLNLPTSPAYN